MPKPELEYFDPEVSEDLEWKPVKGLPEGAFEKTLAKDQESGDHTRLLKYLPGVDCQETFVHDFWEETYILDGMLLDKPTGKVFKKGMYACRPPGMKHGPFKAPYGALCLEFHYYKK